MADQKNNKRADIDIVKRGDLEIRIIRPMCISAATCVVFAPSTFDLDDDNIAIVKEGEWDRLEKVIAAAQSCPVLAIEVFKAGEKVWPLTK